MQETIGLLYNRELRSITFDNLYRAHEDWVPKFLSQVVSEHVTHIEFRCYPLKFEHALDLHRLDEIFCHYPFRPLRVVTFTFPWVHNNRRKQLRRLVHDGLYRTTSRGLVRIQFSS